MRKEYDFSKARRAKDVPHLARLQAEAKGKSRITIMLDNDLLVTFRARAEAEGIGYQTLVNRTLRQAAIRLLAVELRSDAARRTTVMPEAPDQPDPDFLAECRRQSQMLVHDPEEVAVLEWLERVADREGWE